MRTRNQVILAIATPLLCVLLSGQSLAQTESPKETGATKDSKAGSEAVRFHLERANKLYDDGAYEAALIEFERAYAASGNYKILYNLATVANYLRDYASSLKWYREYLENGGGEIAGGRRKEVQKEIDRLGGLVAKVLVVASVADAQVTLDDEPVGKTPLDSPLVLNPGRHRIAVSKEGFEPASTLVTVSAGDSSRVELSPTARSSSPTAVPSATDAAPAATASAAPARTDTAAPPDTPSAHARSEPRPFPWPAWVVTAGLAAGATTTGVLALGSQGKLEDEQNRLGASQGRLDDLSRQTRMLSITTDVLAGLAIASGAVSIYLTARHGGRTSSERTMVRVAPNQVLLMQTF